MSGIPHIYDSYNLFDIYETEYEEPVTENTENYEPLDEELSEKINEHMIEERILFERIKLLEPKKED